MLATPLRAGTLERSCTRNLAPEGLRWGAVNSSSVVGFVGPTKGLLSATEIRKRLKAKPNFKVKTV